MCLEEILQYRREKRDIPPSIARERVKPNTAGFRRIPFSVNLADAKILSIGLVYACLFSIYRAEVEIVARVYRAIFDPFLRRLVSVIRCVPARRRTTTRRWSSPNPSQQPAATHSRPSSSIIYHFEKSKMLLSARVCSKNFIRSPSGLPPPPLLSPLADRTFALGFMKFGDDLKLLQCAFENSFASM